MMLTIRGNKPIPTTNDDRDKQYNHDGVWVVESGRFL
jgi:hypothetical protein